MVLQNRDWLEQPLRSSLNRVTNQHLRMSYSTRRSHGGYEYCSICGRIDT